MLWEHTSLHRRQEVLYWQYETSPSGKRKDLLDHTLCNLPTCSLLYHQYRPHQKAPSILFMLMGETESHPSILFMLIGETEGADSSYRSDSTSLPPLLSLSGPTEPLSGVFFEPPISALQRGHNAFIWSHLSMHSMWKTCAQGSSRRSSLFENFDKQMQQICRTPIIKFVNYKGVICSMIYEKGTWGENSQHLLQK